MHAEPLRDRTQGKWRSILPALGIKPEFLTGKNTACPFCGGKDRWRFINRDGSGNWICNQCGRGDGLNLAMRVVGRDFAGTAKAVEAVLGEARLDREPPRTDIPVEAMKRLWESARPLSEGCPGWRYFERRCLRPPPCLRYSPKVWFAKDASAPAILAKVAAPEGRCVNLYRIFISSDGSKAPIDRPKRMMRARVPEGVAIRLTPPAPTMGVAEGIETALAAAELFGVPVWATIGTEFLERFAIPEGVEELIVFADNDANLAGQKAAYVLAHRAARTIRARVETPPAADTDWNDVLIAKRT